MNFPMWGVADRHTTMACPCNEVTRHHCRGDRPWPGQTVCPRWHLLGGRTVLYWLSRYRRLNTIFERSKEHLIAFVAIAFISILSRRLNRLVVEEISA
jgi:hypothetical protein